MSLPELQSFANRSIGNPGDPASSSSTASAHAKLSQIASLLPSVGVSACQFFPAINVNAVASVSTLITAVDTTKTIPILLGIQSDGAGGGGAVPWEEAMGYIQLTDSTHITCYANSPGGNPPAANLTFSVLVVTFSNIAVNTQQGSIDYSTQSATALVTAVTPGKALLVHNGYGITPAQNSPSRTLTRLDLQDATHVRAQRYDGSSGRNVVYFALIGF